jgi:uncharacterized protein (DUF2336 family)
LYFVSGAMIVRQFLHWVRAAKPGERAEATSALARAYLYSDLSPDDLAAAEGAMVMLLDDPSPLVRRAMAEVFASSARAPRVVVHALAADQADVALPLIARSPLLSDDDLIERVRDGKPDVQLAIAGRPLVSTAVAVAIAEAGSVEACLALMQNCEASVSLASVEQIVARFGHVADLRENLLARDDLPMSLRQALLSKLSQTLAVFVVERQWLGPEHAEYTAREACEKATVSLAADTPYDELGDLVRHLRQSGQLTAGMLLRSLLSGNVVLLEEALGELTDLPLERIASLLHDKTTGGLRALYRKAALPELAYPAFRAALAGLREGYAIGEPGGAARLKRRLTERVLMVCSEERCQPGLLALLRRFAVEAAREEARLFCDELVSDLAVLPYPAVMEEVRLVA